MTLDIHRPYPGVALVVTESGSVLLGAPADAFKATKQYCNEHELPFPRELVAPQALLIESAPQFNPEFFLYDFLFVYGAAFKPELEAERLHLVMDSDQIQGAMEALRITLTGPTRKELTSFGNISKKDINMLATISEEMAIKKGDRPRELTDSLNTVAFDKNGSTQVLGGTLRITRTGRNAFELQAGKSKTNVDLTIEPPVVPFATLAVPTTFQRPLTFGVKPLGTRNGFDLTGPTTGFLLWLNGRAVIYDGPVGTRYLLESQGISPEDVELVILSHCHEDHMGAFVELFLAGYRPKVLTSEPIFRTALIKLSAYFRQPPEQVAQLIDYVRVTPGEPIEELGAQFDFFYTVHSIPTIGMRVSMKDRTGTVHQVQLSGDTMHHDGLDKMHADGVLTDDHYRQMRHLIPDRLVDNSYYYADVGEAIIHGHPQDWAENPNHVIYYHCADNDHTRSFGKELAEPGAVRTLIAPSKMHPATPGRLLTALRFLDFNDPGWFQTILYQGIARTADTGEVLIKAGDGNRESDKFTVIVDGTATVSDKKGREITKLRPGEFYGVIELVDQKGVSKATVTADTPMELFAIDARVFHDYIERRGLQPLIEKLWTERPQVEKARIFKHLDTAVRNQIAKAAETVKFSDGETIVEEGSISDDFYLLINGTVAVVREGKTLASLKSSAPDNFFGEISAIYPERARSASVQADGKVTCLRVNGRSLRHLFDNHMGVRYTLMVAIDRRGDAEGV